MLKRFLTCVVVFALILCLGAFGAHAQESALTMEVDTEVLRVGSSAVLRISVPNGVESVSAFFSDNGKLTLDRSNMVYDSLARKYKIEFDVENGVYEIKTTAKYAGVATVSLSSIKMHTADSVIDVSDAQVQIQIKPKAVEVYTKEDLNNIRNDLSGNYVLMNDIEFSESDFAEGGAFYNGGYGWQPIGSTISSSFKGSFDGNGYAIKGIRVFKADYNYIGLFGVSRGTIENLALVDANIDAKNGVYVPPVESSAPSGSIDYESKDVWTPPTGSINDDDLSGYDRTGASSAIVGGVVAYNIGTVTDCYVKGNVFATPFAGGIVGSNVGKIERCYANVNVNAKIAGVIAGYNFNHGVISDCHVKGSVEASVFAGGICGENRSSSITNCYTLASLSGEGGIAASANGTHYNSVSNVYYLKNDNISDSLATALEASEFDSLTFESECWDYSTAFPILKKLSSYILNEDLVPEVKTGDVNGDGDVNAADLAILKKAIAGLTALDDPTVVNPDVDGSGGNPNAADLALLKKIIAGLLI